MENNLKNLKRITSDQKVTRLDQLDALPAENPDAERISYKRVTEEELLLVKDKIRRKKAKEQLNNSILFFISLVVTGSIIVSFFIANN